MSYKDEKWIYRVWLITGKVTLYVQFSSQYEEACKRQVFAMVCFWGKLYDLFSENSGK